MNDHDTCLALLREADRDSYIACLYTPEEQRRAAVALLAFHAEMERLATTVREAGAGEIRLQWWHEVLAGSREHGGHPVAVRLVATIGKYQLPRDVFFRYLEARTFDLYNDLFPDQTAFEAYAGETSSAILHCLALCAEGNSAGQMADSSGHFGVAWAATRALRLTPLLRPQQKCFIPLQILHSTGLDRQSWFEAAPDARHGEAIAAMTALARQHWADATAAMEKTESATRSLYLPVAAVPAYLRRLETAPGKAVGEPAGLSPLHRQWVFLKAAISGLQKR